MDKGKIIFLFNRSVSKYNLFCSLSDDDQSYEALEQLNEAGMGLYECFEAAIKRTLVFYYKSKQSNKEITWSEFCAERDKIENMHRPELINRQNSLRISSFCPKIHISYAIINDNAFNVTNGKKHKQQNILKEAYEEVLPQIHGYIQSFVDDTADLKQANIVDSPSSIQATQLFEETNYFDSEGSWNYVLLLDSVANLSETQRTAIIQVKWSMVLDLDSSSDENGLAATFRKRYNLQPGKISLQAPQRTAFNRFIGTPYWFFLNGLVGLPDTIPDPADRRSWNQKYGKYLNSTFEQYHKTFEKGIKVVILSTDTTKVSKIAEELDTVYADKVQFLMLSGNHPDFLSQYPETKMFLMGAYEFARSILSSANLLGVPSLDYKCMMPDKDGTPTLILPERYNHFELVHQNIADDDEMYEVKKQPELFYQGLEPLSWYGAQRDFAISRGEMSKWIKRKIEEKESSFDVINLCYEPGIGGSTFARQFAYEMRKSQPTCFLRQYMKETTANQLYNLYMELRTIITVFIDSSTLSPEQVTDLKNEIKPMAFPFVLIYLHRTNDIKDKSLSSLNDFECTEMLRRLKPYANQETMELLQQIKDSPARKHERSPFFMSLYTFEENFAGVPSYIAGFIKEMTDQQKELLVYIAIADQYANRPISETFFPAPLIANEDNGQPSMWGESTAFDSLVLSPSPGNVRVYRIRHYLFTQEILKQIIYQDQNEQELSDDIKASNLSSTLIKFIKYSKTNATVDYDTTLEMMCNLFIVRSGEEINKGRFSPLVEKVMDFCSSTRDGANRAGLIFKTLVTMFPDNGHFKGHLSRFYSYVEENYDKGVSVAAEAATDSEQYEGALDPILYHIYGMSLKLRIQKHLKKQVLESHECGAVKEEARWLDCIMKDADEALSAFQKSRIANNQDAGYQASITLCIDVLDLAKKLSGISETADFIASDSSAWYMRYFDEAEGLMRAWQSEDEYSVGTVQTQINDFYGNRENLERTIELWQIALDKAKPEQVSQCRRLLARAKKRRIELLGYENVSALEIDEIIHLAESNINSEPKNSANIRLWFDAIRYCTSQNSELLLDEAIDKLSTWKYSSGCIEAYYYYFICICIKAIEGSSRAAANIPILQSELKNRASKRIDNRRVYEWVGAGEGLRRLKRYALTRITPEEVRSLAVLTGYVKTYKSENSAIIFSNNMDVFFNPKRAKRIFSKDNEGHRVTFSVGFSYDGLRAYDQSVDETSDTTHESSKTNMLGGINWETKPRVKCRVIRNIEHYVQVKLLDYHAQIGSINVLELGDGYSDVNRPDVGTEFYATIIGPQNQQYWQLSLIKHNSCMSEKG